MENLNVLKHEYVKDFSSYGHKEDNFVAHQEITVSITLNEYRKLLTENAVSASTIEKANNDKYNRESENAKLKTEVMSLKEELYNLKNNEKAGI